MSKLLRANFARLKYSLSFCVCVIISCFEGLFNIFMCCVSSAGQPFSLAPFFCGSNTMFYTSVFIPLFIGTEYSDLTMRNKLVVGHTKKAVYLSNFITASVCTFIIYTAYWLPSVAAGFFLGGVMDMAAYEFLGLLFMNVMAILAASSVHIMLAMLISKKSSSVTAVLVGTFILIFADIIFEIVTISFAVPAEAVLSVIALFFTRVLPFGQLLRIEEGTVNGLFPLYSIAVTAVSTAVGVLIFKRKDLK